MDGSTIWDGSKSPYPGLNRFTYSQAKLYFGREKQVCRAMEELAKSNVDILIITGPSGTGKSSLVYAGILPELLQNAKPSKAENWIVSLRPADHESLYRCLAQELRRLTRWHSMPLPKLADLWRSEPEILLEEIASLDEQIQAIVIDQAEEIFESSDIRERREFIELITKFKSATGKSVPLLITIRDDFLHRLAGFEAFHNAIDEQQIVHLTMLTRSQIHRMIAEPARIASLDVSDVIDRLEEEAYDDAAATTLPLLALTLEKLYRSSDGKRFSIQELDSFGGLSGVISNSAEVAYNLCVLELGSDDTKMAFKAVFEDLFRFDAIGQSPVRKSAILSTLVQKHSKAQHLIETYAANEARLLTLASVGAKGDSGQSRVDIAHEAIFSAWPRLETLISENRNEHLELEHARISANHWVARGRPTSQIHEVRLSDAQTALRVLNRTPEWLDEITREYVFPRKLLVRRLSQPLDEVPYGERAAVGDLLNIADLTWSGNGDSRPGVGAFDNGFIPADYWCKLERIKVGRYPVTQAQYRVFLEDKAYFSDSSLWDGAIIEQPPRLDKSRENYPAVNCSWNEANAYCRWLTKLLWTVSAIAENQEIRMLTSNEWRDALIGPGQTWDCLKNSPANTEYAELGRTISVGLFPRVRTHIGAEDMIGNVWEYCDDMTKIEGVDTSSDSAHRAAMGGSWFEPPIAGPKSLTNRSGPNGRSTSVGFRICLGSIFS